MRKTTFTDKDDNFLLENYEAYGATYCAEKLSRPVWSIYKRASRHLKLSRNKETRPKHPSKQNIDPRQFENITTPIVAYFLGFMWADGYIHHRFYKNIHSYTIKIEITNSDAEDLNYFADLGKWSINKRKRMDTWSETAIISTNSKDIYNLLDGLGYNEKSSIEPDQILKKIPDHLLVYFWRGFFDGDGCFGIRDGRGYVKFSGRFDSTWTSLSMLLNKINIHRFGIYNEISAKGHKSSHLSIQNREGCLKFCRYMLQSEIGLTRKTNKMKEYCRLSDP